MRIVSETLHYLID